MWTLSSLRSYGVWLLVLWYRFFGDSSEKQQGNLLSALISQIRVNSWDRITPGGPGISVLSETSDREDCPSAVWPPLFKNWCKWKQTSCTKNNQVLNHWFLFQLETDLQGCKMYYSAEGHHYYKYNSMKHVGMRDHLSWHFWPLSSFCNWHHLLCSFSNH